MTDHPFTTIDGPHADPDVRGIILIAVIMIVLVMTALTGIIL